MSSDRSILIRLAASLPKGDESRRAILSSLMQKTATGVFSKIPGKSLDQMIMARYQYEFDGEQSSTSREESLAQYRKEWLAMTADKQQEIVKWLRTNRYTVYHDIRKYL
jgi:predicted Fe-S protein YdhL (DUF1289 family)